MSLSPDALAALTRAGFSRRKFLQRSGALVVSFCAVDLLPPPTQALTSDPNGIGFAQGPFDAQGGPFGTQDAGVARQLDSWIAIGADGRVTGYTGKAELGQGMLTAQMQLIAEELSVPLARVTLVQCDTSITPDQGTTSGSQSTPTKFFLMTSLTKPGKLRTDDSSAPASVAPTAGGRTTQPCSMPGTRTLCTYSNWPVTIAGISTRGTGVPSTIHSPAGLRSALVLSARPNF